MLRRGDARWRGEVVASLAVGVAALIPRLAMLVATPATLPVYDLAEYWDRTLFILEHGRLYDNSSRMPGYPLALSFVLGVFRAGPSLEAARLFNVAAGCAAALLTYWLARRTAGRVAALAAGLAVALYPSFVVYTAFTATEAVVTVPLLGALVGVTYGSRRAAVLTGVCAALAALVRPAGIAILPAVLVACLRHREGSPALPAPAVWIRGALLVTAFAITMSPWWIHNARLHDRFVSLDASGGINMAIGNNPHASGTYRWREARHLYTLNLEPVEVATPAGSSRAAAYALNYIREHPAEFVRLMPIKVASLLGLEGREHAFLYAAGFFGPRTPVTLWSWAVAIVVAFPLLLSAAMAGIAVRGGVTRRVQMPALLWIVASVAMHALTFGDPRYHLPMIPVLAVLATGLARTANGFSTVRIGAGVLILGLLAVAWSSQLTTYRRALEKLTATDGWTSQLSYDDLF